MRNSLTKPLRYRLLLRSSLISRTALRQNLRCGSAGKYCMEQPLAHIICLDLARNSKIMQQLLAGMHEHGWNYTIHSACRGWELTQRNWQDRGIAIDAHSKIGQKPGAQGCLWSHMDLWELCASSNRDMIILESDALCVRPWDPRITSERLLKIAYKFQATRPNKRTGTWSAGSAGYLLNPQHASRLLGYVRATSALEVDKLIGSRIVDWQHGPRLFDINTMGYSRSSTKAINIKDYEQLIKNK